MRTVAIVGVVSQRIFAIIFPEQAGRYIYRFSPSVSRAVQSAQSPVLSRAATCGAIAFDEGSLPHKTAFGLPLLINSAIFSGVSICKTVMFSATVSAASRGASPTIHTSSSFFSLIFGVIFFAPFFIPSSMADLSRSGFMNLQRRRS